MGGLRRGSHWLYRMSIVVSALRGIQLAGRLVYRVSDVLIHMTTLEGITRKPDLSESFTYHASRTWGLSSMVVAMYLYS